jgi:hypothetical protein
VFPVRFELSLYIVFSGPTRSRVSVVFLGPRTIAELVPTFHVALHASRAALQIVTFQNFAII